MPFDDDTFAVCAIVNFVDYFRSRRQLKSSLTKHWSARVVIITVGSLHGRSRLHRYCNIYRIVVDGITTAAAVADVLVNKVSYDVNVIIIITTRGYNGFALVIVLMVSVIILLVVALIINIILVFISMVVVVNLCTRPA